MDSIDAGTKQLPRLAAGKRYYTAEEADRALVLVRRIVGDVVNYYRQVLDFQEILETCQTQGSSEQVEQAQRDLAHRVEKLQACADELVELGLELKDWGAGVVDFPALFDGREIMFCWQHDEATVKFWHEVDAGCGGRQEIGTLLASPIAEQI